MDFIVKIPLWKAYLYTLLQRIRIYKWLNTNSLNLNINRQEVVLLRQMFIRYVPKNILRKSRVYKYDYLVHEVLRNMHVADKNEIELAMRLIWIKHLKIKELIMEIKHLKEFAKEVGLKPSEYSGLNEEQLCMLIVKNLNTEQSYSQELIAWYDELDDDLVDRAETEEILTNKDTSEDETDDYSELIEIINETTKIDELKEIAKDPDFEQLFGDLNLKEFKTGKALKEAMLTCFEKEEDVSEEVELNDEKKQIMINQILELEKEEELVELLNDPEIEAFFEGKLEIMEEIDIDNIKEQMLTILGYEPEPIKEKPKSFKDKLKNKTGKKEKEEEPKEENEFDFFDPENFDPEEVYEQIDKLSFPKLRKFAKTIDIVAQPGLKKEDVMNLIADKLQELSGNQVKQSTEETEIKATKQIVKDAIEANDKDTLLAIAEQLNIKLSTLQQKSIAIMGRKLLEVVPDNEPDRRIDRSERTKAKLSPKLEENIKEESIEERKSIYQTIEEMVLNENTIEEITKEVSPYYKEKGKSLLYIRKRVIMMVEIIKKDNDIV